MGVDHYLLFIFNRPPVRVVEFINSNFRVHLEEPKKSDRKAIEIEKEHLIQRRLLDYPIGIFRIGEMWPENPLKVAKKEWSPITYFDLRILGVGPYSLLELKPQPRSSWIWVEPTELLKFLEPFTRKGVLLISGYRDDIELDQVGFEEDDEYLLFMRLVSLVDKRKKILPSGTAFFRSDVMPLEDGLYRLDRAKMLVIVQTLNNYKMLTAVREEELTEEEQYRELLEERTNFTYQLTKLLMKKIEEKIEGGELIKRAEEYLKRQVGEDGS